jgi:hypothetical protein
LKEGFEVCELEFGVDQLIGNWALVGVLFPPLFEVLDSDFWLSAILHFGQLGRNPAWAIKLNTDLARGPIAVLAEQGVAHMGSGIVIRAE